MSNTATETSGAETLPGKRSDSLYYYTDAFGLQGILGSPSWPARTEVPDDQRGRYQSGEEYWFGRAGLLLASDVQYMNDSEELIYASELVIGKYRDLAADSSLATPLREAFARSAATFSAGDIARWPWRIFASCFCEDGDLLSQWRGYAGGTGGFAIGFAREALTHHTQKWILADNGMVRDMQFPTQLVSVAYGDEAEERIDEVANSLIERWNSGRLLAEPDGVPSYFVGLATIELLATIKHPSFVAEREWRVIANSERRYKVKTRPTSRGLVPYMDFLVNARLTMPPGSETPICGDSTVREIVVGPAPDQDLQVAAVHDLLARRRPWFPRDVVVTASTVPFRG